MCICKWYRFVPRPSSTVVTMIRNNNYVVGAKELFVPASLNFGEFVITKLLEYKDKIALINASNNESVTFRQIAEIASNVAVSLVQLGVRKGDVIGICSENRHEFVYVFLAAAIAGAVVTAFNVNYTEGEFKHVMDISKPIYMFLSPTTRETFVSRLKSYNLKKFFVFGENSWTSLCEARVTAESVVAVDVVGQSDPLLVLYSSGTTGLPKGVVLTHLNLLAALNIPSQNEEQVLLTMAPWYHVLGLSGVVYYLGKGWTSVFIPKFDLGLYYRMIEKYQVTELILVPPMLLAMSKTETKHDLSSVTKIFSGAAPLRQDTAGAVFSRFPKLVGVFQGYGLTETSYGVIKDSGESNSAKPGGVGFVVPGTVIKVVNVDTGEPVGPNQRGEIRVKGPTVTKGYIGKDRREDFDEEGFFKTGDIGFYDTDRYFFIVDRLKELIKYKGFQVAPAEIEDVLVQHEAIRDAGVVGIEDKLAGEVPLAFVVTQPGMSVSEDDIKKYVAEKLSNPKHLRGGVRFVKEIPKNPSGKILRKQLRVMANKSKL